MRITRDWTIRRGPDPTAIDGRTLRLRDWAGVCRLNRWAIAKRRRRRFLDRLRLRFRPPAPLGIYPWGRWGFPATARVRRDNPVPDLAGGEGRRGR